MKSKTVVIVLVGVFGFILYQHYKLRAAGFSGAPGGTRGTAGIFGAFADILNL